MVTSTVAADMDARLSDDEMMQMALEVGAPAPIVRCQTVSAGTSDSCR